jgi:hypothetical protein
MLEKLTDMFTTSRDELRQELVEKYEIAANSRTAVEVVGGKRVRLGVDRVRINGKTLAQAKAEFDAETKAGATAQDKPDPNANAAKLEALEAERKKVADLAAEERKRWSDNLRAIEEEGAKVYGAQVKAQADAAMFRETEALARDEEMKRRWNQEQELLFEVQKAKEEALLKQQEAAVLQADAMTEIWRGYILSIAQGMESTLANAFALIGKKGEDLWTNLRDGFQAMLAQMAAQIMSRAAVWGLFAMLSGGAGISGVGAAGSFLSSVFGGLASFDVGTSRVPRDMIAKIHKDEIIVPARESAAIRNGDAMLSARAGLAGSSRGEAMQVTINLSGSATKRDALMVANAIADAQRGRLQQVIG